MEHITKEDILRQISDLITKELLKIKTLTRDSVSLKEIQEDELYTIESSREKPQKPPLRQSKRFLVTLSSLVKYGVIKAGDEVVLKLPKSSGLKEWRGKVVLEKVFFSIAYLMSI